MKEEEIIDTATKPVEKEKEKVKEEEMEMKNCSVHEKKLLYWCTNDSMLVCEHCIIFDKHRGHDCETIEDHRLKGSTSSTTSTPSRIQTNREGWGSGPREESIFLPSWMIGNYLLL